MNDCVPVSSIRVFLLIDNRLLREALFRLFRKRPDVVVVDQTSASGETAVGIIETRCDVLVCDTFVHGRLPACLAATGGAPAECKIILIGMDSNEGKFLEAVRCGVSGYLLQDASAADVVTSVRAVSRGEAVCPPQLCSALFHFVAQTPRELSLQNPTSRPDLTSPAATVGHTRGQRSHKQGNRFPFESFRVHCEKSHPSHLETGGRREPERSRGNHSRPWLLDQSVSF